MPDSIEILLKFAFIGVLYLFLLWIARSALKDLGRPRPELSSGTEQAGEWRGGSGRLVVEHGGGLGQGVSFEVGAGATIGRSQGSDIQIEDGFASGQHARIYQDGGLLFIEDMSSTNGTYLNDQKLTSRELLHVEDRIRIGDTEFRYEQ